MAHLWAVALFSGRGMVAQGYAGVLKQTAQWKLVANKILIFKQTKERKQPE